MNRFCAKSFAIAVGILLSTTCDRLVADETATGASVVLNVHNFSAKGDGKTDDSLAFSSALKALEKGGTLVIPSGVYIVGDLKIGNDVILKGVGVPRPILVKSPKASDILELTGEVVAGTRRGVNNVTIESMTLRGRSVEDGFKEHIHNVIAMGVKHLTIHNVIFEAFQGDGLYLGSGYSLTEPVAHNSDVIVSDSEFRGVNSANRNGISIIDCDRCIVEHNSFTDLSRADMPGPIDIEPNRLDEIIQNIIVRNNTIVGTKGAGAISIGGIFQRPQGQILLEGNSIEHAKIGFRILRSFSASTQGQILGLNIRHNTVRETDSPLVIDATSGVTVASNTFSDSPSAISIRCNSKSNFSFEGNLFERVGSESGSAIQICGMLSTIVIRRNIFIDSGSTSIDSSAIFFSSGIMDDVSVVDNKFSSPRHLTRTAVRFAKTSKPGDKLTWTGNVLRDGIQAEALQ